jgi:hypothetical protein
VAATTGSEEGRGSHDRIIVTTAGLAPQRWNGAPPTAREAGFVFGLTSGVLSRSAAGVPADTIRCMG